MDKELKELSDFFKSRSKENKRSEKERIELNSHLFNQAQKEAKTAEERLDFEKIIHDSISFVNCQFGTENASIQKVDFKKTIVSIQLKKQKFDLRYFDSSSTDEKSFTEGNQEVLIVCDSKDDYASILHDEPQLEGYVFNRITEKSEQIKRP